MSVAALCRVVQSQWQALADYVWPEAPEQRLQAEIIRRSEDLAERYRRLVSRRRKIEALRDRVARSGRENDRKRLAEHEEAYARQRLAYLHQKQIHLALLRGDLSIARE